MAVYTCVGFKTMSQQIIYKLSAVPSYYVWYTESESIPHHQRLAFAWQAMGGSCIIDKHWWFLCFVYLLSVNRKLLRPSTDTPGAQARDHDMKT